MHIVNNYELAITLNKITELKKHVLSRVCVLLGIGERWNMISRCIEERMAILNTVVAILTNQEYLDKYLDKGCQVNQFDEQ